MNSLSVPVKLSWKYYIPRSLSIPRRKNLQDIIVHKDRTFDISKYQGHIRQVLTSYVRIDPGRYSDVQRRHIIRRLKDPELIIHLANRTEGFPKASYYHALPGNSHNNRPLHSRFHNVDPTLRGVDCR